MITAYSATATVLRYRQGRIQFSGGGSAAEEVLELGQATGASHKGRVSTLDKGQSRVGGEGDRQRDSLPKHGQRCRG